MRWMTCLTILLMLVALPSMGLAQSKKDEGPTKAAASTPAPAEDSGMPAEVRKELWQLIPTVAYFLVGLVLFGFSILLMEKVAPFSIRKEIEDDQNTSLGVLMGCALIGLAIIMAAAMK